MSKSPTDATLGTSTYRIDMTSTPAIQHERQSSVSRSFGASRSSLKITSTYIHHTFFKTITNIILAAVLLFIVVYS